MGKHHRRSVSVIPIASPLAGHRLTRKIGNLITQSAERKQLVYGVKDTGKALRKKEKGLCVLGGNVSPMDVITHIPGICEDENIPYVFVPTKEQISAYAQRTSPVACVVIRQPRDDEELTEQYNAVLEEIQGLVQQQGQQQ